MKRQTVWVGVMAIIMLLMSGCAEMLHQNRHANVSDNVDVPPDIANSGQSWHDKDNTRAVVTLHVVGQGIAPEDATSKGQAIILGECAARSNGYVKLAEKIYGVYVESYRQLGRGMVDVEIVRQETQALLRGAEVLEYRQLDNGIFEAYMRVKIIVRQDSPLYHYGT
jgi:hypothetical protein